MYDKNEMQFFPDEPKIIHYDFSGEPIYEGDEYVEYDGEKILLDDMAYYAKEYIFSSIYVAGDYV
ncbi:hypothetical protein KBI51_08720 [Aerococcaceae bacterium zg-ZUI334]|uniref:hypothetical protein n=1 Tax=Aerococcaceae TaxID=186827 RepID=UPI0013B84FF2|nr:MULTISPECIES: hypothetical protein [unclassified Facklamia]MBR7928243.1 hypothetical protein [Aerococcaceae bacterium zg-ZUI334]NEW64283.1 hypothetical protein [Facklamia sp. 252]NEW67880.1 hypothetical protein [Facklamia sp. 253]QQD64749.1 hypothetical protein JDW14_05265 [Aerococcaceae bacterium zg-252]